MPHIAQVCPPTETTKGWDKESTGGGWTGETGVIWKVKSAKVSTAKLQFNY